MKKVGKMAIFGEFSRGTESSKFEDVGINEDLIPFQRVLPFSIFDKNSFCILIIFFKMGFSPPPKMAKTLEGQ